MLLLSDQSAGDGWRIVQMAEPLKTLDQFLNVQTGRWRPSEHWTSEQYLNIGKVAYRRPVSFGAKVSALKSAIPKMWRRLVRQRSAVFP